MKKQFATAILFALAAASAPALNGNISLYQAPNAANAPQEKQAPDAPRSGTVTITATDTSGNVAVRAFNLNFWKYTLPDGFDPI
jgi:hypothetical protein